MGFGLETVGLNRWIQIVNRKILTIKLLMMKGNGDCLLFLPMLQIWSGIRYISWNCLLKDTLIWKPAIASVFSFKSDYNLITLRNGAVWFGSLGVSLNVVELNITVSKKVFPQRTSFRGEGFRWTLAVFYVEPLKNYTALIFPVCFFCLYLEAL